MQISETFSNVCYWISRQILRIVGLLSDMFDVFAGGSRITYDGRESYLANIFITNDYVELVYVIMAAVGVALSFGFALAALLRRVFDAGGRGQVSVARILGSLVRSIALILLTQGVLTICFGITNTLLSFIHYSVEVSSDAKEEIVFTDEMRATMGRALNTLGNYSLNDSYSDTVNINLCFNAMRRDLLSLQEEGVFAYDYYPEENGDSWQSVLAAIARSADVSKDLYPDTAYPEVSAAVLDGMEIVRTNRNLPALSAYTPQREAEQTELSLDTLVFLMMTMDSARNETFNENPSVTDTVRNPFFTGERSIYDVDAVSAAFDLTEINWLIMLLVSAEMIFCLAVMLFNCITRIFSLIFLYVISPGVFSTMPFDDGSRTREWGNMFLVQFLGVFATVIPMKLILLFIPIILDAKLVMFESGYMNQMAKLILIVGAFEAARRASNMLMKLIANQNRGAVIGASEMKMLGKSFGKAVQKSVRRGGGVEV